MGTEIERKFLVRSNNPMITAVPGERLRQGYLAVGTDGSEARVRACAGRCTLTVKRGTGVMRDEYEVELTEAQFDELWPATAGSRVDKVRRLLPHGSRTLVIDQYTGALWGLATVEVEFGSPGEAEEFEPLPWFGPEVSFDERFKNQALATRTESISTLLEGDDVPP